MSGDIRSLDVVERNQLQFSTGKVLLKVDVLIAGNHRGEACALRGRQRVAATERTPSGTAYHAFNKFSVETISPFNGTASMVWLADIDMRDPQ